MDLKEVRWAGARRMVMLRLRFVFLLAFCAISPSALGQEVELMSAVAESGGSYGGSAASKTTRSAILPEGRLELGGELVFVTAEQALDSKQLRFSDVAMLPLHVRAAPSRWLEISGGTSLLVKQSESMDEPVWQGSDLTFRVPFGSVFAGTIHGAIGPLMQDQGIWWQGESSLLAKLEANEYLRFELCAGYTLTALRYSDSAPPNAWIHEVMTHGEVQLGGEGGGGWIGVDYYVPVASGPGGSAEERPGLDPNVRLNLQIGGVLSPRRTHWNLYAAYAVIDRGDVEQPGTTLPILAGGFDQRLIMLGVQHYFDFGKRSEDQDGWP